MDKVDDFEQWTKGLAASSKQTRKSTAVCPKPIIPKDKKKRRNSARPKETPLQLEKNMKTD